MLNISPNTIGTRFSLDGYKCFSLTELTPANKMFTRWLLILLVLTLVFLFLPWTQNIQAKGKVTTLRPEQRPQAINATISGRIEKWYVREGETVEAGDTIAHLSEIKAEYFDPGLVERTKRQVEAKRSAVSAYGAKVKALDNQIAALRQELDIKEDQLTNKLRQAELKVQSNEIDFSAAETGLTIAGRQFDREQSLFDKGLESLTDLEGKELKQQMAKAKRISAENKMLASQNELDNVKLELLNVRVTIANKIAKAQADKFSTLSQQYDAEASLNKLEVDYENYRLRAGFYFITAPQSGFITKTMKSGVGEIIKDGDPLVTIVPNDYQLAVELYVKPVDFPLIQLGQEVRFIFDGWPAFIFSGWPGQSFGTYKGAIVAIENVTSENGKYRILVSPNNEDKEWPYALRPGSGAQGIALLNNVPMWYEIWRQLNGFPPDFYEDEIPEMPKLKAPVKSIPK
jgi:adhesin transport system membrane fusion protein